MAAKLLFSLLLLLLLTSTVTSALPFPPPVSADAPFSTVGDNSTYFIRTSCGATLYPAFCFASLSRYATEVQQNPVQLAWVAANVTLARVRSLSTHVSFLCRLSTDPEAAALRDCVDALGDAEDQMRQSTEEIRRLESAVGPELGWRVSNAQTWMSAALTNEDTCAEGFDGVVLSPVKADVCSRVRRARKYTSNALALVNSLVASR